MLNYANASGIEYAGISDGNHWEFYDVFRRGALEERRILDVFIADAPAHESALKLLLLWRPNLASGHPVTANTPLVENDNLAPSQLRVEQVSTSAAANWIALSENNPPSGTPSPAAIRFWDGSERSLMAWREILLTVVEKLYGQGRLTVQDVPLWRGSQRYRVHTEPVHPNGKRFEGPKPVAGTPLFVNTHLSAADVRRETRRLLKHCSLDPTDVHLKEGQ